MVSPPKPVGDTSNPLKRRAEEITEDVSKRPKLGPHDLTVMTVTSIPEPTFLFGRPRTPTTSEWLTRFLAELNMEKEKADATKDDSESGQQASDSEGRSQGQDDTDSDDSDSSDLTPDEVLYRLDLAYIEDFTKFRTRWFTITNVAERKRAFEKRPKKPTLAQVEKDFGYEPTELVDYGLTPEELELETRIILQSMWTVQTRKTNTWRDAIAKALMGPEKAILARWRPKRANFTYDDATVELECRLMHDVELDGEYEPTSPSIPNVATRVKKSTSHKSRRREYEARVARMRERSKRPSLLKQEYSGDGDDSEYDSDEHMPRLDVTSFQTGKYKGLKGGKESLQQTWINKVIERFVAFVRPNAQSGYQGRNIDTVEPALHSPRSGRGEISKKSDIATPQLTLDPPKFKTTSLPGAASGRLRSRGRCSPNKERVLSEAVLALQRANATLGSKPRTRRVRRCRGPNRPFHVPPKPPTRSSNDGPVVYNQKLHEWEAAMAVWGEQELRLAGDGVRQADGSLKL